jgi:predicted aconitase with swiveling domain
MKSFKTTSAGVLAIVVAVGSAVLALLQGRQPDFTAVLAAIIAGIGLINAKDNNVTGGTIQQ